MTATSPGRSSSAIVDEGSGKTHRVLTCEPDDVGGRWEPSRLPVGQPLRPPEPLFKKLDDEDRGEELARMSPAAPERFLIDTHAHLDDRVFADDLHGVLERAADAGVENIVSVGTDLESSRAAMPWRRTTGTSGHPWACTRTTPPSCIRPMWKS